MRLKLKPNLLDPQTHGLSEKLKNETDERYSILNDQKLSEQQKAPKKLTHLMGSIQVVPETSYTYQINAKEESLIHKFFEGRRKKRTYTKIEGKHWCLIHNNPDP